MTRHLSEFEVRSMLARIARQPADDVDGYVVILMKGSDLLCTISNAVGLGSQMAVLASAIDSCAVQVQQLEEEARRGNRH